MSWKASLLFIVLRLAHDDLYIATAGVTHHHYCNDDHCCDCRYLVVYHMVALTTTIVMQVWHLASLPKLEQLLFSDPDWGASPIARLCNYATYAAVNLPNLRTLDSQPLTAQTKAVAEATYLKKKMYYNMRISTLRQKAAALAQQAQRGLEVTSQALEISQWHSGAVVVR